MANKAVTIKLGRDMPMEVCLMTKFNDVNVLAIPPSCTRVAA